MLVDSGKGTETLDSLVDVLTKHPKDLYPGNLVSNTLTVAGKISDQRVRGVLLGGNLSLVEAMYGSVFLPSLKGAILFLEETNEPEYRVDRMLEALTLRGIMEDIRGVVLGNFTNLSAKRTADSSTNWSSRTKERRPSSTWCHEIRHAPGTPGGESLLRGLMGARYRRQHWPSPLG
jgi:muramoyltetrapeptide carboxypeptidase LdcA involved in peptidoglycan recycling